MDAIFNRRSIRKYQDKKISQDEIKLILRAGMSAPTALHERPWKFIVIDDREILGKIPEFHPRAPMLRQASHAVFVCGDRDRISKDYPEMWVQDCSAATQNMLTMANYLGIGAVWIGVYSVEILMNALTKLFSLPENIIPFSIVSLGYPAEEKEAKNRYDESMVHYNKW